MQQQEKENPHIEQQEKVGEWQTFLLIVVFLLPALTVFLIAGYGFAVWMSQIFIFGPPGHG